MTVFFPKFYNSARIIM